MDITVETPKGSFVKYRLHGGKFVRDLISPLPTFFNYGFIEGTKVGDGMPEDCIIIGRKLKQGERLELTPAGEVYFTDDCKVDNKKIFTMNEKITTLDKINIHLFFTTYAMFKTIRYIIKEHRLAECRYGGFKLL